jgi:hypothetical protein
MVPNGAKMRMRTKGMDTLHKLAGEMGEKTTLKIEWIGIGLKEHWSLGNGGNIWKGNFQMNEGEMGGKLIIYQFIHSPRVPHAKVAIVWRHEKRKIKVCRLQNLAYLN